MTFEENIAAGNVLVDQKKFHNAIQHFTEAVKQTEIPEQQIDLFNTIARLFLNEQDILKATEFFEKSLTIHDMLPDEKAQQLILNKATILNNLGIITLKNDPKQAINYHKKALGIFTKIDEEHPKTYSLHLANTHYSLGDAFYTKKDFYNAKKYYKDAIKIYEGIDDNNNTLPLIANAYYNLGNIYTDENNVFDARNNYLQALKIFRSLTEKQPEAFRSLTAATFNNLAVTAKAMYKYSDAITYYENALKEYEKLIAQDRSTFLPFYAATLNSIGIIYTEQHEVKDDFDSYGLSSFSGFGILSADNIKNDNDDKDQVDTYRKEKAVEFYTKALEVYNELANAEPETYTHYVATCLHNLGVLFDEKKDYKNAEEYYAKALYLRRTLAEKHPEAFNLDTCVTLLNITTMYQNLLEITGEIGFKTEALKILKEIEERLGTYGNIEKPVILSMKSDTQYFTQYFNEVDEAYLEILTTVNKTYELSEKINETLIPSEKLQLQKHIVNMLYGLYGKYPENERLQQEMLGSYIQYSWFALRSNQIGVAEKAIENGLKIAPESLELKANLAHLHLIKNEVEKAIKIYLTIKDLENEEKESFKKVLETDLNVLKNDGVLTKDISSILSEVLS